MLPTPFRELNQRAWQRLARCRHRLTLPARPADFERPLASVDGPGWLGPSIRGWDVLCLAAGGGRQGPLYAAAGARVTVVDLCGELLQHDRDVAAAHNLSLSTVQACMTDLSALASGSFDLVVHPVSTCYVPDPEPVFREVARVCRPGGLYISQHKQPASLQASLERTPAGWVIQFPCSSHQALPPVAQDNLVREPGTLEFVHPLQAIFGGICRAGFVIEDLIEPPHADPAAEAGSFAERSCFLPPYLRIKARRCPPSSTEFRKTEIWQP